MTPPGWIVPVPTPPPRVGARVVPVGDTVGCGPGCVLTGQSVLWPVVTGEVAGAPLEEPETGGEMVMGPQAGQMTCTGPVPTLEPVLVAVFVPPTGGSQAIGCGVGVGGQAMPFLPAVVVGGHGTRQAMVPRIPVVEAVAMPSGGQGQPQCGRTPCTDASRGHGDGQNTDTMAPFGSFGQRGQLELEPPATLQTGAHAEAIPGFGEAPLGTHPPVAQEGRIPLVLVPCMGHA